MRVRREMWFLLGLGVVLVAGIAVGCRSSAPTTRGVIVVLLDAARADHLGAYGYTRRATTPNIDEIARSSILFERAYTSAAHTVGATAHLWTGAIVTTSYDWLHPFVIPKAVTTLPEVLASHGIETAFVGANPLLTSYRGFGRGVDFYHREPWSRVESPPPERLFSIAENWIKSRKKPFFIYIHLMQPHDPYRPPLEYGALVGRPVPPRRYITHGVVETLLAHPESASKYDVPSLAHWYDANLRWADAAIGAFYRKLQGLGFFRDGWLVITADHGEALGEHGRYMHNRSVYEETIRVPLIVRPPDPWDGPRGRRAGLVYMQDLFATVLDWFRIPIPRGRDSLSLVPILRDPRRPGREAVVSFSMTWLTDSGIDQDFAIIYRKQKLIFHIIDWTVELYHLPDEAWPSGHLAPRFPREVQYLYQRLRIWRESGNLQTDLQAVEETRELFSALGYIAGRPTQATVDFRVYPSLLSADDLRAAVRWIGWQWSEAHQKVGMVWDVQNRSSTVWPSLTVKGVGGVGLRVEILDRRGQTTAVIERPIEEDVWPQASTRVSVPVDDGLLATWSGRVRLRVYQRGRETSSEPFELSGVRLQPVATLGQGWHADGWMGGRGAVHLYRPPGFPACLRLTGVLDAFHEPRRWILRDDQGRVVLRGRVVPARPQPIQVQQVFPDGRHYRRLVLESLDGAAVPADVTEGSPDERELSFRISDLRVQPCH